MYSYNDKQHSGIEALANWAMNKSATEELSPEIKDAIRDILKNEKEEVDLDKVMDLLGVHLTSILKEIGDIMADGKVNFADLDDAFSIFNTLKDVVGGYPELKRELSSLNETEQKILGSKIIELINEHI